MARGVPNPQLQAECVRLRTLEKLNYNKIHARTGVSKATLSAWLRDYPLPEAERVASLKRFPPISPKKDRGIASELGVFMAARDYSPLQVARISETAVMLRLLLHGFAVFGSSFDGDVADWVVQTPGTRRLYTIQVKTVQASPRGLPLVSLRNSRGRRYTEGEFDFIVGFDPHTDIAYVWSWGDVANLKATVTVAPEAAEAWDKLK